ncbi:hypothetical protein DEVEQU_02903 [Devosia equisanguinis]|uniref:Uncharacterized protein n=1 Tax=Devosia equisanguinis TaxID=2490941 RepID=A0A447IE50_9HYPH|nr:hypothetical protein [Devosia equisanguinis]VDS05760.1 hypothetical protein DEVEQU_02903 [Devosia equisanguinis]
MLSNRFAALALAATVLTMPALAEDKTKDAPAAPSAEQTLRLKDLDATRINPNQITIEFEYDGGACEQVGPAEVGELVDGTLSVTFPTISTAEVCTMQVVEIEVEQTIQAEHIVSKVDVTLNAPDGKTIASGTTDVDHD